MTFFCVTCSATFTTRRAFRTHVAREHKHPKPKVPSLRRQNHYILNGRPCDENGHYLPPGTPPPPPPPPITNFEPFPDRPSFEFAELTVEKMATSREDIDHLLRIIRAKNIMDGVEDSPDDSGLFPGLSAELQRTLDAIPFGDIPWFSFKIRWSGPITPTSPAWKRQTYVVHTRDPLAAFENTLRNAEYKNKFDVCAYKEFTPGGKQRWCDFMSGLWAWKESSKIALDPSTRGAMLATAIVGADKTTVSVASGDQEFHPVYVSLGNLHNDIRRGHGEAVIPLAFLAIPKGSNEDENDPEFRIFKKQIYHRSLAHIFEPLRPWMTTPRVTLCPDGHFRRVIYSLGPFIADYPEQVYLSGVVQGWCPKCFAAPDELGEGALRFRELTQQIKDTYSHDPDVLWDAFGIAPGVKPFTDYFPRADIHEALSPDLLHQLIKGTFKDHLVEWVLDYIRMNNSAREANTIIDALDRRLRSVPAFPGLRRFKQGRNFKQWTGDDSKALMKIFIPAIADVGVPGRVVECVRSFMDFCYIARRSTHDEDSLRLMETHLRRFHELREVFREEAIRANFTLPRQHALMHYVRGIRLFGSPNGLCSSITESKHIRAVKKPWRATNKNNPLQQILKINCWLSKIAAARSVWGANGLLRHDGGDAENRHFNDIADVLGEPEPLSIELAKKPAYSRPISRLDLDARLKTLLPNLIRRFLHEQLDPPADSDSDSDNEPEDVDIEDCPRFHGHVAVYYSARALYYAPSELSGPGGMHSEVIRSHPLWYGKYERRDTVLVQDGPDDGVMGGMVVARVLAFLSFSHNEIKYPCALIQWLLPIGDAPDPTTGMWVLEPEVFDGERAVGLIHTDCIVRACHTPPVYGRGRLPADFDFSYSHLAFKRFYLNKWADYHVHECYPLV
ncbi:uncharacterized protein B0H18DRAFT_1086893 [Fomitopsis serialis]|uniref:uncharacterized protein n=1 Tax=Fomitopsis serialis TaxID=139415 RepID=UPI002008C72E|nr:uncharacterized protein B0H18DRAFT_1086893 [Neoantrodia serialis]KAH9918159.1 hypothetical protein B0H18DRAFT_1086893 [Neoantrodia serialis]